MKKFMIIFSNEEDNKKNKNIKKIEMAKTQIR